ncbi:CHASE2 domain-containing protein [Trichocoleus sp. FACHB-262]|uniref:CHASE2 domain-containing protein n=1 Tax=Trichocoleus sp. FACHB-262 TaxID=2692869 RepID=UPI001682661D|nr:CHASE2 domain-containing protein [Trichocoleus sp. FACHB-262]MBD2123529.1 CHASE2 domain-containing protein [Trichocoleus sp. FACHB-262]
MARSGRSTLKLMLKTVLLTSLVLTAPIVAIRWWGGFEEVELNAYDRFLRQRPPEEPDDRVVVITIGERDIEQLQQYPIHDGTFADLLEKLESYQPRGIGFDISRDVPHGPLAGRKRLTEVIAQSDTIISGCMLSSEKYPGSPPAPGTTDERVAFVESPEDFDKTVRRSILISTPTAADPTPLTQHLCNTAREDNEILSLSLHLALIYLEGAGISAKPANTGEIQLDQQLLSRINGRFGSYTHADTPEYQMMLNYRGAKQVVPEVSISDVLQGKITAASIRDRVVLIGSTSLVSKDLISTPYIETGTDSGNMHGVLVHAQAVSQILSAVLDQRQLIQSWSEVGEIFWIWGWALGSGLLAFYNRRLELFLLGTIATGLAVTGLCYALFLYQGLWVPFVPTLITGILTALGVRFIDLANRTGYSQAIYEQLLEQWRGGAGRDRKGDYLEQLVLRARLARHDQTASELITDNGQLRETTSPQVKALYEQISQQVQRDLAAEKPEPILPSNKPGNGNSKLQARQLQTLLSRARQSRSQSLSGSHHNPAQQPPSEPPV